MSRHPRFLTVTADAYRSDPIEAEMTDAIAHLVGLRQGRLWHLDDARTAPELVDMPDLVFVIPGLVGMLEVKSNDRPFESLEQERVAALLADVRRVVTGVCRPKPRDGEYSYEDVLEYLKGVW